MGHGIVQIAAQGGFDVVALETNQGALDNGIGRIEKSLSKLAKKLVEKGKKTEEEAKAGADAARARITPTTNKADLAEGIRLLTSCVCDLDQHDWSF